MNTGAITKRYATALLRLTRENGSGERVCRQIVALLRDPSAIPQPLEPDLQRFISLLVENKRTDYLRRILRTYVDLYCEESGFKHVMLTSAVKSEELEARIQRTFEEQNGCRVILETAVDPALIGGFRVEVDGMMLDASVRRQLDQLQRQFIEKNNRIV